MLPAFLFAMYEKDGMPLEKILWNVVTVKLLKPSVRRYEVENWYEEKEQALISQKKKGEKRRGKKWGDHPGQEKNQEISQIDAGGKKD